MVSLSALNQGRDTTLDFKSPLGVSTTTVVYSSAYSISTMASAIFFCNLGEKNARETLPTFLSSLLTGQKFSGTLIIGSPSSSMPTNFSVSPFSLIS